MKKRLLRILIVAAILSTILWFARRNSEPTPTEHRAPTPPPSSGRASPTVPETPAPPPVSQAPSAPTTPPIPPTVPPKTDPLPAPSSPKRDLGNPFAPSSLPPSPAPRSAEENPTIAADLDKIALMLRDYRTIAGENPVGTNAEIMKALMGDNPRGAKLGPPEGMSLNGKGELTDAWGTPIFFHQLSRDLMEIISAGPDQRFGTDDDLMLK